MAIKNQKFWDLYPEARVPRQFEPDIPYVDFAIVRRILLADGKVWPLDEPVPQLGRDDLLYRRCSDDPRANVMRFEGKWYSLTRPQARRLSKGVWGDGDGPTLVYGM